MRFALIINRDGGTVRSIGVDALREQLEACIRDAGLDGEISFVRGKDIEAALRASASVDDLDLVMVGGGDGTVSTAARILSAAGKPMGLVPLGTMNLFARALAIPTDPAEAVMLVRDGRMTRCDLGEVNERRFAHHVTLGLHPRMARLREKMHFASRFQKIFAAVKAYLLALRRAPLIRLALTADGETEHIDASIFIVTNNQLGQGPGHLPYSDSPDRGVLGLYHCPSRAPIDLISLSAAALAGQWQDNPQLEASVTDSLEIDMKASRALVSIDGELVRCKTPLCVRTLPGALQVLCPIDTSSAARS